MTVSVLRRTRPSRASRAGCRRILRVRSRRSWLRSAWRLNPGESKGRNIECLLGRTGPRGKGWRLGPGTRALRPDDVEPGGRGRDPRARARAFSMGILARERRSWTDQRPERRTTAPRKSVCAAAVIGGQSPVISDRAVPRAPGRTRPRGGPGARRVSRPRPPSASLSAPGPLAMRPRGGNSSWTRRDRSRTATA